MPNRVVSTVANVIAAVGSLCAIGCSADLRHYEDVVALWKKGDIVPDRDGVLRLPEKYKSLSREGNAYVTQFAGGKHTGLLFILRRGKATNMVGILYTDLSPPPRLQSELTVRMTGPPGPPPEGPGMVPCDESVVIDKIIKPQWYSVCHNLE